MIRVAVAFFLLDGAAACTNLIVTKGASKDGSSLFSYSADSGSLYGTLGLWPAAKHAEGTTHKIYDWDSGQYLGVIEEAEETYNVVGNVNEHGVAIGETTFGGNETLANGEGVMDYGNLIWTTLQRSKTAKEAIHNFEALTQKYGYVSEGESFTIADKTEIWILEMIGKGKYEKGAVWVAVRLPDGHVSGHANQARIQKFPLDDPENCIYSKDVIDFATKVGLWDSSLPKSEFNFAEAYDPITPGSARMSDARVWSFFSDVAKDRGFRVKYNDYVMGRNVSAATRMPLSIEPAGKVSAFELMDHMRNHYEGTELDGSLDVGAGPSGSEFRVRPLTWKYKGASYINERKVGTEQTGWVFVAQLRDGMPSAIGSLIWFGVDDASFANYVPFHGGTMRVPKQFADGTGDALTYSQDSAFWAFNTVANFVYPRWFLADAVVRRCRERQASMGRALEEAERKALAIHKDQPEKAMEMLTSTSERLAEQLVKDEMALFGELMVKHRDGFRISARKNAPDHGGRMGGIVPVVEEVGYSQSWYGRIVTETGDHYKLPDSLSRSKLRALSRGVSGVVSQAEVAADGIVV